MADYEDYAYVAKFYDQTRIPVGYEIELGCLATSSVKLSNQRVLDLACGTGNYSHVLAKQVGQLVALDRSEGMLEVARQKTCALPITFVSGEMTELPFEDESFDGVLINQALHHLPHENTDQLYPSLEKVLREVARVLKKNGIFVVNTCSHRQLRDGYWWADLVPDAVEQMIIRYPPTKTIITKAELVGLHYLERYVPFEGLLQGPDSLDPQYVLEECYRRGDSTWSLVPGNELIQVVRKVEQMVRDQSFGDYLDQREKKRSLSGQVTLIHFVKKASFPDTSNESKHH